MPGSKIVVNHRVMLSGSAHHGAIGGSRLLYIANRPGAVTVKSNDDLRIERENERMAKLSYIGFRPGSVPEPNGGHALFDAQGVPERARVQRELKGTDSAIITSMVSVRREDAEALGLTTKQDWERLLRSQWPKYIESMGVMEPQDVRWVAAYHVNQENNLHCHVFTWDDSGRFNELLPKQRMSQANDELRAAVLRPQRDELSLVRTQARDELAARLRGLELGEEQRRSVIEALPSEGSLKYARLAKLHSNSTEAVDAAVCRAFESDESLRQLRGQYFEAAAEHGRLKGLEGARLEAHMSAAEADLRARLGNALISNVRNASAPSADHGCRREPAEPEYEIALPPAARRRAQQIYEESVSCLGADGRERLAKCVAETSWESISAQRLELERIPSIGVNAASVSSALSANTKAVLGLAERAMGGEGGDFGDESSRRAVGLALRSLGVALAFAERQASRHALAGPVEKRAAVPVPKM